jgi:hypothetical protein
MLGYFLVSILESLAVSQMRAEHLSTIRKLQDELIERRLSIGKGDEQALEHR